VAGIVPAGLDPATIETNIVFVDVAATGQPVARWVAALAAQGLLVTTVGGRLRMLTHIDVSAQDIGTALAAWRAAATELGL
jgi:threonine aldolase